jgi:uncharacterized protein (TIGR02246 family)
MSEVDVATEELAIRRLLAEYCHAYDDRRTDDFAALFADDAEFRVFGQVRSGRAEIHDHIGVQQPGMPPGQHVTYNTVIDIDPAGVTARAWTDFLYLRKDGDGHTISNAGRYHDRLVREPDRWRFQTRTIVFLGDDPPPDRE